MEGKAIWVADTHPALDSLLPEGELVIRCGELQLQAYDGCMRSILQGVYERRLNRIVVLGCAGARPALAEYVQGETAAYLMKHVHRVDPDRWLGAPDVHGQLPEALRLLREHPFMPKGVEILAFVYDPAKECFTGVSHV
ncbi:hypothetical protein [Ectobacillus ponti]|uniref:Carbonic anhydrase n=1 Tax=Ectobacillus ponti TaxID=2961894 RepID=A0AA42BPT2_9BACI|nr:hypothetical protein [Ectobacillus ponti]MCP8967794.1 hypothetical protein [Ectobacillus ponti]